MACTEPEDGPSLEQEAFKVRRSPVPRHLARLDYLSQPSYRAHLVYETRKEEDPEDYDAPPPEDASSSPWHWSMLGE